MGARDANVPLRPIRASARLGLASFFSGLRTVEPWLALAARCASQPWTWAKVPWSTAARRARSRCCGTGIRPVRALWPAWARLILSPDACFISSDWCAGTLDPALLTQDRHVRSEVAFAFTVIGVFLIVGLIEGVRRAGREFDRRIIAQHLRARAVGTPSTGKTDSGDGLPVLTACDPPVVSRARADARCRRIVFQPTWGQQAARGLVRVASASARTRRLTRADPWRTTRSQLHDHAARSVAPGRRKRAS